MSNQNRFLQLLAEKPYLLADGATGTNLFAVGLETGDAPELWNTDEPDKIRHHYRQFADAGSDIILTNTFGGNRYRLKLHNAESRVQELNANATQLLHEAIEQSGRTVAVAGSIGPTGEILEPNGSLTKAQASEAFHEQALALKEAGADVLWIETMSSIEEVEAAVDGVKSLGLPIVFTMSVDTNGRTMMGITPQQIMQLAHQLSSPIHACGTNCGVGASEVVATVNSMVTAQTDEAQQPLVVAKANCGIPEWVDGEIVYNGTPELMSEYVRLALDAGARIIGGCCGTSYQHVAAMRQAMDDYHASQTPDLSTIETTLGEVSEGAKALMLNGDVPIVPKPSRRNRRKRSS